MANIALRNPQFKSIVITQPFDSIVCAVTIDGVLRYTLVKNIDSAGTYVFDIAELARDYLEIKFLNTYVTQKVDITSVLTPFADPNGGGQAGTAVTYTDKGFEAYGTFEEGVNPAVPFRSVPSFLMSKSSGNEFTILAPIGLSGTLPSISSLNGLIATSYSTSDTSITVEGNLCNIKRIDCTKYGNGNKITFINKYGAQQDLWFFLKETKNLARTNEGYKSNTITYTGTGATYDVENAPNKVFNTQAKQTHNFSSGFYPEFANQFFEELLLSEYIWINPNTVGKTLNLIPVKVKTSSMAFKTSLNDRLIEYTIEFEEAFDYINNIR